MVGALHMLGWTREERWRELYLENVEQLWRTWLPSKTGNCHLWTQDLYGRIEQLLGAGHGFAGNAYALLRGAALLSGAGVRVEQQWSTPVPLPAVSPVFAPGRPLYPFYALSAAITRASR